MSVSSTITKMREKAKTATSRFRLRKERKDEVLFTRAEIESRLVPELAALLDVLDQEARDDVYAKYGQAWNRTMNGEKPPSDFGIYMAQVFFAHAVFDEPTPWPVKPA